MLDDNDAQYIDFYFGAPQSTAELETLEISQPAFSQVWRLQSQYRGGFWARLESGELVFWQYVPMRLRQLDDRGNLDFGISVTLGDLGEILPDEIERARQAGTLRTFPPTVRYRAYRSDDLETPMVGPVTLQARKIVRNRDGAQCDSMAPQTNVTKTGMLYRTDLFPMLLGYL
ncbi:DUF1833 domain-containing protein [Achromobacter sp. JUb104]|uniref:DUF1833 domain-containing protein n=1 Tax=Achromobacter sp. JUb104 TaxID=2940590 RepID=UPI002168FD24|nr:DUF1833 domain-containing protein [Achromobacter sp. JUb104]MCS3505020.1 hypothetical protein [Achromobacter sp. JUb104]